MVPFFRSNKRDIIENNKKYTNFMIQKINKRSTRKHQIYIIYIYSIIVQSPL